MRTVLIIAIIYFLYKLVTNSSRKKAKQTASVQGKSSAQPVPPPYDPGSVEDIEYQEVKKKK